MPLGHSVGFWGSSVPSVAQFIAARSLSVAGSLSEPTGAQPGDVSFVVTRGGRVNGSDILQPASGTTPPTGWSLYAWESPDDEYVIFTKVRGASADGPLTVTSGSFLLHGDTKIAAGSDWICRAATWGVIRGTVVTGQSGGYPNDSVGASEPATANSLTGAATLEVFANLGLVYEVSAPAGWTRVHRYNTGQDAASWHTRENPPNPTGTSTFPAISGGSSANSFDLHLILSA